MLEVLALRSDGLSVCAHTDGEIYCGSSCGIGLGQRTNYFSPDIFSFWILVLFAVMNKAASPLFPSLFVRSLRTEESDRLNPAACHYLQLEAEIHE